MNYVFKLFLSILLCGGIINLGSAQSDYIPGNVQVRNYTPEEYSGYFQNWSVIQDTRGVMYFANNSKVLEYDGKNWELFSLINGSKALSVATDSTGVIYAGGIGEIGYLDINELGKKSFVSLVDKIPEEHRDFQNIWRVVVTDNGVFFKSKDKIFQYIDNRVNVIDAPVAAFFYAIGNDIFITDSTGVKVMIGNEFKTLPYTEELNSTKHSLVHATAAPNGQILLTTRWNGIYTYNYQRLLKNGKLIDDFSKADISPDILKQIPTTFDEYMAKYQVYGVCRIDEYRYALATLGGGVIIMDHKGKMLHIINKNRGLIDDRVYYLYVDKQKNLWAATNNGISCIYTSSPFTYFDSKNGLNTGLLKTIRYEGTLYTSTYSSLYFLPEHQLSLENDQHLLEKVLDFPAWSIGIHKEQLFVGVTKDLYQIKDKKAKLVTETPETVYSLGYSPKFPNHLFLGLRTGLASVELTYPQANSHDPWVKAKPLDTQTFIDHKCISQNIVSDHKGNLWLSTENKGIWYIEFPSENISDFTITKFDTLHGLPFNKGNTLYKYKEELFIGTNEGIYELEENSQAPSSVKFVPSPKFTSLPKEYQSISAIVFDNDDLYLSTNTGSGIFHKTDSGYYWNAAPFKEVQSDIWNKYVDSSGISWHSSNNSLIRYDSKVKKNYEVAYEAVIRKVIINADSTIFYGNTNAITATGLDSPKQLGYEDNNIKFEYTSPFYEQEESMVYRYILEGFDKDTATWAKETTKEYTNLSDGKYCFKVQAKNKFGNESSIAKYYFTIHTPWYKSRAAYFFYVVAFGAILYLIVKLNTKRLEQEKQKLEVIITERTSEIMTQNEELQQQSEEIAAQRDHIEAQNTDLVDANVAIREQKERIEKSYDNINILSDIGRGITSNLQTKEIIKMVYEQVNRLMSAEAFGIGIYNKELQTIDFDGFIENGEEIPYNCDNLSDSNALSVWCFSNKKEVMINDFKEEHTRYIDKMGTAVEGGIPSSIMYRPLLVENEAIGVITVQSFKKNAYTAADQTVLSTLASYVAIAIANANSYGVIQSKNANITDSIRYARTIQTAILPKEEHLKSVFGDIFIIYRPKDIVSGDFYWHSQVIDSHGKHKQFIAVADCTGHGVPGAFMSMIGNTLLDEIITIMGVHDTNAVLEELDTSIKTALRQEEKENNDGMDIALCCMEEQADGSVTIEFSGAKRPLYWYSQATNTMEKINGTKRSIGGYLMKNKANKDFNKQVIQAQKGDIVYLGTDGMADQADPGRKKIGSKKINELLIKNAQDPLQHQQAEILKLLDEHQQHASQRDDITMIGIKL